MATPVIAATAASVSGTTDANSFTPTLPGGSGGALLALITADGQPTLTTSSTDWEKLGEMRNGTVVTHTVFLKRAATGSDALVVNSSVNEQFSGHVLRVTGSNLAFSLKGANGSSTNSNPPAGNTGVGAKDVLWIATRGGDSTVVPTAAPANYTGLTNRAGGGTAGASTSYATRALNAASEDPGTFTVNTEQWVSWTIAIWEGDAAPSWAKAHPTTGRAPDVQLNPATSQAYANGTLVALDTQVTVNGAGRYDVVANSALSQLFQATAKTEVVGVTMGAGATDDPGVGADTNASLVSYNNAHNTWMIGTYMGLDKVWCATSAGDISATLGNSATWTAGATVYSARSHGPSGLRLAGQGGTAAESAGTVTVSNASGTDRLGQSIFGDLVLDGTIDLYAGWRESDRIAAADVSTLSTPPASSGGRRRTSQVFAMAA